MPNNVKRVKAWAEISEEKHIVCDFISGLPRIYFGEKGRKMNKAYELQKIEITILPKTRRGKK